MNQETPTYLNVDEILRQRVPQYHKRIPKFLIKWLARIIHQDELNTILQHMVKVPGVGAAHSALHDLNITVQVMGEENIPHEGRFIFVSNHPLGGLDGLSLISTLGRRYNGNIRFLVNDLLMAVKPLQPIFLPVNEYGRQPRAHVDEIERQYQGANQIITFPAGICSRQDEQGRIRDLKWHKSIVSQAVRNRRDIIPIFFEGVNSKFFYRMAKWRKRLGIKFNFELIFLPGEMFKCKGKSFNIHIGKPIKWNTLDTGKPHEETRRIYDIVYAIAPHDMKKI